MLTIVVPLDGYPFSERAIPVACSLARLVGGRLQLVRVTMPEHAATCDEYLRSLADSITDIPTTAVPLPSEPGQSIADRIRAEVDRTEEAVVCMSLHGRSGLGSAVLGTSGEQILHALDQPVLVVGRHCSTTWTGRGRLLLPLDGSPEASGIVGAATALARSWDLDTAVLQVVHAFDNEVAEQVEVVERACSDLRLAGVRVSSEVECSSNSAVAIVGHARRGSTSLIMMASFVHPGVPRTLLGSVTMNTIRDAPCPVLVCPPGPVDSAPLLSTAARPAPVGHGGRPENGGS